MKSLRNSIPALNALAVFEVAARHCSLTLAAAELNIAQSAVSRHVANLEARLDIRLFERCGNKLTLTATGAELAHAIGEGLGKIRDTVEALQRRQRQDSLLTVACSYAIAHDWLMPRFGTLRNLAPDRQLRLLTSDLYIDFDAPDVDMSIRYGDAEDWPGLVSRKLFDELAFPVCAPSLLAAQPGLDHGDPAAWANAPLLHLMPTSQGSVDWGDWFLMMGTAPPQGGPMFNTYTPMLQEAISGRGIALGWKEFIDPYLASGDLIRLGKDAMASDKAFYVVYRPDDEKGVFQAIAEALCSKVPPGLPIYGDGGSASPAAA